MKKNKTSFVQPIRHDIYSAPLPPAKIIMRHQMIDAKKQNRQTTVITKVAVLHWTPLSPKYQDCESGAVQKKRKRGWNNVNSGRAESHFERHHISSSCKAAGNTTAGGASTAGWVASSLIGPWIKYQRLWQREEKLTVTLRQAQMKVSGALLDPKGCCFFIFYFFLQWLQWMKCVPSGGLCPCRKKSGVIEVVNNAHKHLYRRWPS